MSELRWNPVLQEWVVTATHRMERPQMPNDWCPFCPGSGRVPDTYDVYIYPNDFPTFSVPPPEMDVESTELYKVAPAIGVCDVVLYTPEHDTTLTALPVEHIIKLVRLWKHRFCELAARPEIHYVFEFENKGEVIGVTMPHPHGQIYAFNYIPPKIEKELHSAQEHYAKTGRCLFCDIINEEKKDRRRIIFQNNNFFAVIPFYARWPYELHIFSQQHLGTIAQFGEPEITDLANILKIILQKYDNLFGFSFPYMMVLHQSPTDREPLKQECQQILNGTLEKSSGLEYPQYHFHIEFYPPYRSATKLKYLAGCESGAGTFINDSSAEEKAAELRNTEPKS
ncbi:MAG: galactose-1-phosphate uridylyltransferase [bacterium]|nr:galactose-1-phosphate uridylyltransferase [bacterium]